ncbi:MAG: hypothetical protein AAGB12_03250 [Pseudomonadota bacterium]
MKNLGLIGCLLWLSGCAMRPPVISVEQITPTLNTQQLESLQTSVLQEQARLATQNKTLSEDEQLALQQLESLLAQRYRQALVNFRSETTDLSSSPRLDDIAKATRITKKYRAIRPNLAKGDVAYVEDIKTQATAQLQSLMQKVSKYEGLNYERLVAAIIEAERIALTESSEQQNLARIADRTLLNIELLAQESIQAGYWERAEYYIEQGLQFDQTNKTFQNLQKSLALTQYQQELQNLLDVGALREAYTWMQDHLDKDVNLLTDDQIVQVKDWFENQLILATQSQDLLKSVNGLSLKRDIFNLIGETPALTPADNRVVELLVNCSRSAAQQRLPAVEFGLLTLLNQFDPGYPEAQEWLSAVTSQLYNRFQPSFVIRKFESSQRDFNRDIAADLQERLRTKMAAFEFMRFSDDATKEQAMLLLKGEIAQFQVNPILLGAGKKSDIVINYRLYRLNGERKKLFDKNISLSHKDVKVMGEDGQLTQLLSDEKMLNKIYDEALALMLDDIYQSRDQFKLVETLIMEKEETDWQIMNSIKLWVTAEQLNHNDISKDSLSAITDFAVGYPCLKEGK